MKLKTFDQLRSQINLNVVVTLKIKYLKELHVIFKGNGFDAIF